jgi:hypothetical protein
MKKVNMVKRQLDLTLSAEDTYDIRSEINEIQSQILKLNNSAEALFKKLVENKVSKLVQVIEEIDDETGHVCEYYNGQMISEKVIPSLKSKVLEEIPQIQENNIQEIDKSSPTTSHLEDGELDLLAEPVLDPDYAEDSELIQSLV